MNDSWWTWAKVVNCAIGVGIFIEFLANLSSIHTWLVQNVFIKQAPQQPPNVVERVIERNIEHHYQPIQVEGQSPKLAAQSPTLDKPYSQIEIQRANPHSLDTIPPSPVAPSHSIGEKPKADAKASTKPSSYYTLPQLSVSPPPWNGAVPPTTDQNQRRRGRRIAK